MGRQGVSKGVSLFYEGMPIDYLNNDSSHDWINLQTKIYHFFDKISIFSNSRKIRSKNSFLALLKIHENLKFEVQNPHLKVLEIRKGQEGSGPGFHQLTKMICNWPR